MAKTVWYTLEERLPSETQHILVAYTDSEHRIALNSGMVTDFREDRFQINGSLYGSSILFENVLCWAVLEPPPKALRELNKRNQSTKPSLENSSSTP